MDQKQHLQLMDTFLQLFHLLWTRTACVLCHRAEASQYEFYVQMVYKSGYVHFIIGVTGDCPETSGIEQVALNGLIRPSFRNQGSGMIKRFQGIFEYHISHLAL